MDEIEFCALPSYGLTGANYAASIGQGQENNARDIRVRNWGEINVVTETPNRNDILQWGGK